MRGCATWRVAINGGNSVCAVITAKKEAAVLITPEKGLITGFNAGISSGFMLSTAQNVQDLIDQNETAGLSAGAVEGNYTWDKNNPSNWGIYSGFGEGLSVSNAGMVSLPVTGQRGNSLDTLPILYHAF